MRGEGEREHGRERETEGEGEGERQRQRQRVSLYYLSKLRAYHIPTIPMSVKRYTPTAKPV
jgi:hypothetical protein